jgi:hypothetical protein
MAWGRGMRERLAAEALETLPYSGKQVPRPELIIVLLTKWGGMLGTASKFFPRTKCTKGCGELRGSKSVKLRTLNIDLSSVSTHSSLTGQALCWNNSEPRSWSLGARLNSPKEESSLHLLG